MFSPVALALSINYKVGPPGISKTTQCALVCQRLNLQHIVLRKVLREKSEDRANPYADFIKGCLDAEVDVPIELKIDLLELEITKRGSKKLSLVDGFPETLSEISEFRGEGLSTHACRELC